MIVHGEVQERALEAAFDYVVIGSGAAGATVARTLVDAGVSIAVLEEGPAVETGSSGTGPSTPWAACTGTAGPRPLGAAW